MSHLVMEYLQISELNPVEWNPRRISDKEFSGLKNSIKTFGFVDPVIVNRRNMHVCGGHQRLRAAKEIGIEKVPVVYVDLDEAQERALNVTLNSHAVQGKFDNDILSELLIELKEISPELYEPLNLDQLGEGLNLFSDEEIEDVEERAESNLLETFNFTISCSSAQELDEVKEFFNATKKKVKFEKFKECT